MVGFPLYTEFSTLLRNDPAAHQDAGCQILRQLHLDNLKEYFLSVLYYFFALSPQFKFLNCTNDLEIIT